MTSDRHAIPRFIFVGFLAVAADWTTYAIFFQVFPHADLIDKSASYFCGTLVSFVINGLWTFDSKLDRIKLVRHFAIYSLSLIANTLCNHQILQFLHSPSSHGQLIALFAATILSSAINYVGLRKWVFV